MTDCASPHLPIAPVVLEAPKAVVVLPPRTYPRTYIPAATDQVVALGLLHSSQRVTVTRRSGAVEVMPILPYLWRPLWVLAIDVMKRADRVIPIGDFGGSDEATIRVYVSSLRKILGGDSVVACGGGYRLRDGIRVDVTGRHLP